MSKIKGKLSVCACRSRSFISPQQVARLAAQAEAEGYEVEVVADLCLLFEEDSPKLTQLGDMLAACHPRAVTSMLKWRNMAVPKLISLREDQQTFSTSPSADIENMWLQHIDALPQQWGRDAWFPTIDKDRCTECGKCLDFCPFGVYEMIDDRIKVVHPTNCKNNCPACARNCPSEAIIFPKYERSPINGGVEQEEKAIRVDHSTLYADVMRARLVERRNLGTPLFKLEK